MRVTTLLAKSIVKLKMRGYSDVFTEAERNMLQQIAMKRKAKKENEKQSIAGNRDRLQTLA